jgi:hypothetical protein
MTNTDDQCRITNGKSNATLYAVVLTDKHDVASIFTDGSVTIRWESGRVTDITPKAGHLSNPDEDVEKIIDAFTAAGAASKVHIVPATFADEDAIKSWFMSIGVALQSA